MFLCTYSTPLTAYIPIPKLWDRITPLPNPCAAVTTCKLNNSPPLLLQHAVNGHNQAQPFNPTGTIIAINHYIALSFSFEILTWYDHKNYDHVLDEANPLISFSWSKSLKCDAVIISIIIITYVSPSYHWPLVERGRQELRTPWKKNKSFKLKIFIWNKWDIMI